MEQIEKLRDHLDRCDEIILDALIMRSSIIEDIIEYKQQNNMPIVQPEQEAKKRSRIRRRLEGKAHIDEILNVFDSIVLNSKKIQSRALFDFNIVLIGFMGAGKSTVSKALKDIFAMDVIEMDEIISEREGMTIPEIFELQGEEYFRNKETELLKEMQQYKNVVISCGGGVALRDENVVEMKKNGKVVLLTADPETILERVKNSHDRPLLEDNKNVHFIQKMITKRNPKYTAAADIVIRTDHKTSFEICEEIISSVANK